MKLINLAVLALVFATIFIFSVPTTSTTSTPTTTSFFDSLINKDNQTEFCQKMVDTIMSGKNFTEFIHADLFSINFNTNGDIPVGGNYFGEFGLKSFANKLHNSVSLTNSTMDVVGVDDIVGLCAVKFTTHFTSKMTGKSTFHDDPDPEPPATTTDTTTPPPHPTHHSRPVTIFLSFKLLGKKYIGVRLSFQSPCEYKWASSRLLFDTQLHIRNLARAMYAFGYKAKKVLYHFFSPLTTVHISPPFIDLNVDIEEGRKSLAKFIDFARKIRGCPEKKKHDHHHCPRRTNPFDNDDDDDDDSSNDDVDSTYINDELFNTITSLHPMCSKRDFINTSHHFGSESVDDHDVTSDPLHNSILDDTTINHLPFSNTENDNLDNYTTPSTLLSSNFEVESMLTMLKSPSDLLFGPPSSDHHPHPHPHPHPSPHHHHKFNPHCLMFPIVFPYISFCQPEYATQNTTAAYLCVPPVVPEAFRPYISDFKKGEMFSKWPLIRVVFKFNEKDPHKIDDISYTALQQFGYVVGDWTGSHHRHHHGDDVASPAILPTEPASPTLPPAHSDLPLTPTPTPTPTTHHLEPRHVPEPANWADDNHDDQPTPPPQPPRRRPLFHRRTMLDIE